MNNPIGDLLKKGEPVDMSEIIRTNTEFNEQLKARAKPYDELVKSLECTVVSAYDGSTSFDPRDSLTIPLSPHSRPYQKMVQNSHGILEVISDSAVKVIRYNGSVGGIDADDRIRVYIFKGEEIALHDLADNYETSFNGEAKKVLVERDFQEEEDAVKIEKLKGDKVVHTYG